MLNTEADAEFYARVKPEHIIIATGAQPVTPSITGIESSDYPYENFKDSVDFVKNLPLSKEDKEKILWKNADKYILNLND